MYRKVFMFVTAIAAWAGLAIQLYLLISNTPGNGMTALQAAGRFLLFFTVLSNILVATSLSFVLVNPGSAAGRFFSKEPVATAITLYIFIVGLVYNLILRNLWQPTGLQKLADEILHVIVPVLYVLYWIFYAPKKSLQWKNVFIWLLFPLIYLVYAMARGAIEGYYPYPFLDLNKHRWEEVLLNIVLMLAAFVIIGLLLIALSRIFKRPVKH